MKFLAPTCDKGANKYIRKDEKVKCLGEYNSCGVNDPTHIFAVIYVHVFWTATVV